MKPVRKRKLVDEMRGDWDVSIRRACRVFLVDTSTYHYKFRRGYGPMYAMTDGQDRHCGVVGVGARPFAGPDPPAAVFFYLPDCGGEHPEHHLAGYAGLMQADAYPGFNRLYEANRKGGPIVEAACWAHARRKFFDLARLSKAPIAAEAVKRIDGLFAIEREINGLMPQERLCVRQERSRPLIIELQTWLREQRARLSKNNDTTKAINYSLNRWDAFTRFLDDGRLCVSNNAAERGLRAVALGRRNWTFAGSDKGGRRRRCNLHADRHRQAQRRRSAGLARRPAGPVAKSPRQAHSRTAALELEPAKRCCRSCVRLIGRPSKTDPPCGPHRMRTPATLAVPPPLN